MKKKHVLLVLGLSIALAVGAAGCGSTSSDSASADASGAPMGSGDAMGPGDASGGPGGMPGGMGSGDAAGFGGGANTQSFDYDGEYSGTLTADGEEVESDGETIEATETDVNGILVENGGTATVTNATVSKSGDDTDGDNCNFYGVNAIALSVGEDSTLYISDSRLTADSEGSNALFATDSGTIYASGVTISTTSNSSRGLDATYDGTIIADSMTISTEGDHCATIATDRGGGTVSATNSTLTTEGSGSPILYSTGDIEVSGIVGTASGSQVAGMEGYNTIIIDDSDLESTLTGLTGSDPVANAVIIYQSTSGDAETSTGSVALFQATDSTLTSAVEDGAFFYVTNTSTNIVLSNTTLDYDSESSNLLQAEGNDSNGWGTSGSNGATVTFTALGETIDGTISVDTISYADVYLLDGTTWTGATEITENSDATEETDEQITINVSSDSTWVVTESCTVSSLNVEDGGKIVDEDGNTVSIVVDGKTVVEGDSDITVTVEGDYSTTVETDEDNEVSTDTVDRSAFDDYYGTSTQF